MQPTLRQLFGGFLEVALSGFGGVLAWAHRSLVERRAWLSERDFTELLALSQMLPGGNIINMAILIGNRFHGLRGVGTALLGLLLAPFCLLLILNLLLDGPAVIAYSGPALRGAAPVVAGLTLATGLKMARAHRWTPRDACLGALTLGGIVALQAPLLLVLAVLAPVSLALAWRRTSN